MFNVEIRAIDGTWFVPHGCERLCAEEAYALASDLTQLAFLARARMVEEDLPVTQANQTLSRRAALAYIQHQRDCTAETAEAILSLKPVAARWTEPRGNVTYYYSKDLDA